MLTENNKPALNRSLKSTKPPKSPLQDTVVFKKYCLSKKLGTGAFGQIYLATNKQNEEDCYAVKMEPVNAKHPQIVFQAKLYKWLNLEGETVGIPKVHALGMENGFNMMMMDLLGSSLEDLFVKRGKRFSVKTVLMIAMQLIDRIEFMHSKQFLHRDMKPDNLLMGVGKKQNTLYIVDMGLAKKYIRDGKHIAFRQGKQLTGTARYASIATHQGQEQARRDDIESIGYVLVYFLRGTLPWQNMKAKDPKQKYDLIKQKKVSTDPQTLCKGLPQQFADWLKYARSLKFEQEPEYEYLRSLVRKAMKRDNIYFDFMYDWVPKA